MHPVRYSETVALLKARDQPHCRPLSLCIVSVGTGPYPGCLVCYDCWGIGSQHGMLHLRLASQFETTIYRPGGVVRSLTKRSSD